MRFPILKPTIAAVSSALMLCAADPVLAQSSAGASESISSPSSETALSKAEQKKQIKAQRKAERKAARAKNSAELKKLEESGYRPGVNDPNYPQDLQDAQKKANAPVGTSQ